MSGFNLIAGVGTDLYSLDGEGLVYKYTHSAAEGWHWIPVSMKILGKEPPTVQQVVRQTTQAKGSVVKAGSGPVTNVPKPANWPDNMPWPPPPVDPKNPVNPGLDGSGE